MRLIDADELIKSTQHAGFIRRSEIEAAPTVDAVQVVRCRSCRHYNTACCSEGCGWCECRNFGTWDEWYCADGEAGTYEGD